MTAAQTAQGQVCFIVLPRVSPKGCSLGLVGCISDTCRCPGSDSPVTWVKDLGRVGHVFLLENPPFGPGAVGGEQGQHGPRLSWNAAEKAEVKIQAGSRTAFLDVPKCMRTTRGDSTSRDPTPYSENLTAISGGLSLSLRPSQDASGLRVFPTYFLQPQTAHVCWISLCSWKSAPATQALLALSEICLPLYLAHSLCFYQFQPAQLIIFPLYNCISAMFHFISVTHLTLQYHMQCQLLFTATSILFFL